ncbi:MAG: PIN domain-containing protein [Blastocatellia bacterium]
MIDVLRNRPPALAWLQSAGPETFGLPGLVVMELLQGCRNMDEQRRIQTSLQPYILHWPDRADCARALTDFAAYRLSHNLGLLDSLIAETAIGLGAQLATFNVKHYQVVTALQTLQPYARS